MMFKFFKKKKTNEDLGKLPHEIFPKIVFFEKNDFLWSTDTRKYYHYLCVDESGIVKLSRDGQLRTCNLNFLKNCVNESLNKREYEEFEKNSGDSVYMKFLQDIRTNYKYLKD